jgi:ubiquinone/menaquinone biosynthesis C-methylase UbiE
VAENSIPEGLQRSSTYWSHIGAVDPLWAIVTRDSAKNNLWNLGEFFQTGVVDIQWLMDYVQRLNYPFQLGTALDFGCGVGRLSQALCAYFENVVGIDISPPMIERANQYNQYGNRCHYMLNRSDNLSVFADSSFDFIYSALVLQHMPPVFAKGYIREFMRVLKPGGLAVFEIPGGVTHPPLKDDGFSALIDLLNPPATLQPHERVTLNVSVRNTSKQTWVASISRIQSAIRLGNHWLDADGRMVMQDDGRQSLDLKAEPGETVTMPLMITAPKESGAYILELDMVQEHIAWFQQKGSTSYRTRIVVTDQMAGDANGHGDAASAVSDALPAPTTEISVDGVSDLHMEMFDIPIEEVIAEVRGARGTIISIHHIGRYDSIDYVYAVSK